MLYRFALAILFILRLVKDLLSLLLCIQFMGDSIIFSFAAKMQYALIVGNIKVIRLWRKKSFLLLFTVVFYCITFYTASETKQLPAV